MDKWQDFINEGNPNYRARVKPKRLTRDMNKYLKGGSNKAQAGSPFKKAKYSFKGKGFNDISAPALEEVVEPETFEKHDELNPKYWQDDKLNRNISKRLIKIAKRFLEGLELPVEHAAGEGLMTALVEDVRFTGSLANYNWSKYSDVDLHLVIDFNDIDDNVRLVEEYLNNLRWRWNNIHYVKLYGHEVEIYFENVGHVTHSKGIYSLLRDEWIIEPDGETIEFDYPTARKKADSLLSEFNLLSHMEESAPYDVIIQSADRLLNRIHRMRKAGLNSPDQEYSAENIAFKILRREEIIDKLKQMKYNAIDRRLSIEENFVKDLY